MLALQVRKVAAERDRANQEVRTSGQVVDFLTGLFKSSDPTEAKGKDVTARQLLDRGRERIPALQEEPLVQADLLAAMASSYESLGLPDIALDLNRRALDLRMTLLGPGHRKSIAALGNLANCYLDLGRFQEAEPYYRRSLELRRRTLGEDDPSTLRALGNLAGLESELQHPREAVRLFRETLAGFQRIGKVDREAWNYQNNLAKVLLESGRPDESATLAAASLEAQRRVLGPDHPDVLHSLLNLGLARAGQGRNGEALALLEEAWSKARAILGQDHPLALRIGTNLAVQLAAAGHAALAEHLYREVLPIEQAHLGPYALLTLQTENNLGVLLTDHGQLAEAERLLEAVEEGYRKNFGDRTRWPSSPPTTVPRCGPTRAARTRPSASWTRSWTWVSPWPRRWTRTSPGTRCGQPPVRPGPGAGPWERGPGRERNRSKVSFEQQLGGRVTKRELDSLEGLSHLLGSAVLKLGIRCGLDHHNCSPIAASPSSSRVSRHW